MHVYTSSSKTARINIRNMNHFSVFRLKLCMNLIREISTLEDNVPNGLLEQEDGTGASTPSTHPVLYPPEGGGV